MLVNLIRKILGEALFILPLTWGAVSPSWTGDVVVADVKLGSEQIVTAREVTINPRWTSVFDNTVMADEVIIRGIDSHLYFSDPLLFFRCLRGDSCQAPGSKNEKAVGAGGGKKKTKKLSTEDKRLGVARLLVTDGQIVVHNAEQEVEARIIRIDSSNLILPLGKEDISLNAKLLIRDGETPAHPVTVLVSWTGYKEELAVRVRLKDFPLSVINKILSASRDTASLRNDPKLFALSGSTSGRMSGDLTFRYKLEDKTWRVS